MNPMPLHLPIQERRRCRRRLLGAAALAACLVTPLPGFSVPGPAGESRSADLAVSGFLFLPATMAAGAHPEFTAFVLQNNGPDALLDDAVRYECFLSRAPFFTEAAAIPCGHLNDTLRLGAGERVAIVFQEADRAHLSIPADASGSYFVFMRAQAATVGDPDPANNAVRRAGVITVGGTGPAAPVAGDFDGDGRHDLALYQESSGSWSIKLSASGYAAVSAALGGPGRQPLGLDFDGDGRADPAVVDSPTGDWAVMLSAGGYSLATLTGFGGVGFTQAAADYDGDGLADPAVYEEAAGAWQVRLSASGYAAAEIAEFGGCGWTGLAADFDGDGRADPAVYHAATGDWIVKLSAGGYVPAHITAFGGAADLPLADHFDGDGRADAAVYNLASGTWRIMLSAGDLYLIAEAPNFGGPAFAPAPGDFDGDGLADPAIYHAASSTWHLKLSASGYATVSVPQ